MKKILFILSVVVLIAVLLLLNLKTNRVGTGLLWGDSPYIITHSTMEATVFVNLS